MKRRTWLALSLVMAVGCGGGSSAPPPPPPNTDATLYAQAVQDYNGRSYSTAKAEFLQLLSRPSATAYYDKATIYVAAIDFYQGNAATCLSVLGSPTPPTSGFFMQFPASADMDRARYWHGRCEVGLTPPAYTAARDDFTAVIGMAGSTYADNAYLWRGRTFYATALASGDEHSADWSSALADFTKVITSYGNGTTAPEAQYWIGRTHFAVGEQAKGRGTGSGDTMAQAELSSADTELKKQLSTYPAAANTWVPDTSVYLGRTHFEQASWAADKVTAYAAAGNELQAFLGTAALIRDEANYWYGRALHEEGLAHETAAVPDFVLARARLDAATAQLQKFQSDATLSTSKLADNASYWVGRCLFSVADLLKVQAIASGLAADWASAQSAFATAQTQFMATKTNSQYTTSNVLDWVQVYLGRSQYEQGVAAQAQAASATTLYAGAQTAFTDYFVHFGSPVLSSAAAAHYWRGRTDQAQASPGPAITEFQAVVAGWDYVGIASTARPTTTWWDNSQDKLVQLYADQATPAGCSSAQSAYDALKAALPADPLLPGACTYMKSAARCPANTCP